MDTHQLVNRIQTLKKELDEIMKPVTFDYEQYDTLVMLNKEDWAKIVEVLKSRGITVQEKPAKKRRTRKENA